MSNDGKDKYNELYTFTLLQLGETNPTPYNERVSASEKELHCQLINSSWVGILTALSLLIEAATDESMTENILKALQNYAALCGILELQVARDAFITAICKASLPPHYALSVLNMSYLHNNNNGTNATNLLLQGHTRGGSQDMTGAAAAGQFSMSGENEFRQVVAVGSPLPTSSMTGSQQGPVMLTAKNLHCMRALLNLSHCHGSILGSSWLIVLATLQHLVWILGLKPSTGGSLQAVPKPTTDANAVITTAVLADLPMLSQMLSQLFESSQSLDDVALHHLIDALCKLSREAMEMAYSNREPSLFAVAKLLETGVVNLFRIEVVWRPLTKHLLEVCQHPHIRMREWGVEAITYLVRTALQYKYETPLRDNQKLQTLLLSPLAELSEVPHGDVRQRQLECVLQVLNSAGETLSHGWPLVLGVIGAVSDHHGETLIRIAFQCLQLVVTDFLPVMPWRCLPLCVNTAAKFGSQTQELNISLTAIGLMWNISDYFSQNQEKLTATVTDDLSVLPDFPGTPNMPQFDKLWMCLYARLGDLCVDTRPAVRKSAGQTLFSTITAHGNLLNPPTWQAVLWQVLFPLLEKVRNLSITASNEKVDTSGNILIHHSRNTAQKQWAETQVLALSGVAKVFNNKRDLLQHLGDFARAWSLLLGFIENAALSKNNEVSLAALKSLQELLYNKVGEKIDAATTPAEVEMWNVAWNIWLNIGLERRSNKDEAANKGDVGGTEVYHPSQAFLSALVQIFPALFQHIRQRFSMEDLDQFCGVIKRAVAVPVHTDSTPYIMSPMSDSPLTPLHDGVLSCLQILQQESLEGSLGDMLPAVFYQLLEFSRLSCEPPGSGNYERFESSNRQHQHQGKNLRHSQMSSGSANPEWVSMNYIPFGEKSLTVAVRLYQQTAENDKVVEAGILHEIIKAVKVPLALKYQCMSSSTWKLAVSSLIAALQTGLPVARKKADKFGNAMWVDLAEALDLFLFPKSVCTVEDRSLDEIILDEGIDCQIIDLLREEVLPFSTEIPHEFILKVVVLLNKGSIHSATTSTIGEWGSGGSRCQTY